MVYIWSLETCVWPYIFLWKNGTYTLFKLFKKYGYKKMMVSDNERAVWKYVPPFKQKIYQQGCRGENSHCLPVFFSLVVSCPFFCVFCPVLFSCSFTKYFHTKDQQNSSFFHKMTIHTIELIQLHPKSNTDTKIGSECDGGDGGTVGFYLEAIVFYDGSNVLIFLWQKMRPLLWQKTRQLKFSSRHH